MCPHPQRSSGRSRSVSPQLRSAVLHDLNSDTGRHSTHSEREVPNGDAGRWGHGQQTNCTSPLSGGQCAALPSRPMAEVVPLETQGRRSPILDPAPSRVLRLTVGSIWLHCLKVTVKTGRALAESTIFRLVSDRQFPLEIPSSQRGPLISCVELSNQHRLECTAMSHVRMLRTAEPESPGCSYAAALSFFAIRLQRKINQPCCEAPSIAQAASPLYIQACLRTN